MIIFDLDNDPPSYAVIHAVKSVVEAEYKTLHNYKRMYCAAIGSLSVALASLTYAFIGYVFDDPVLAKYMFYVIMGVIVIATVLGFSYTSKQRINPRLKFLRKTIDDLSELKPKQLYEADLLREINPINAYQEKVQALNRKLVRAELEMFWKYELTMGLDLPKDDKTYYGLPA